MGNEKKFYAGIGSRETPPEIMDLMTLIAKRLAGSGFILRSGGAKGADSAFEAGAGNRKEIFKATHANPTAIELVREFVPHWANCNAYVRKLHGRNLMIVWGPEFKTPVKAVICWTKNGKDIGGTGVGIRAARHLGIQVHNLANPRVRKEWEDLVNKK
jgi:hypothetical protein